MYDLLIDHEGVYKATLLPGEYIINADAADYMNLSEYLVPITGEFECKYTMNYTTKSTLNITAIDIDTGKPMSGTLIKLSTLNKSMNVENLTDVNGKTSYITDGHGHYNLLIQREGYITYTKEMCISKISLNDINVPLIPIAKKEGEANIKICVSGDKGAKDLILKIFCPKGMLVIK